MIFNFLDEHFGLSKNPYNRLETLMTDLYNPLDNNNQKWLVYLLDYLLLNIINNNLINVIIYYYYRLHYSSYLMLSLSLGCANEINEPLFKDNLSDSCTFERMKFDNKIFDSQTSSSSSLIPLFSLDRTQNDFSTQTIDSHRNSGYIRGTQEVSWTQTQAFPSIDITSSSLSQTSGYTSGSTQITMGAPQGLPRYLYTQQQVPKRFISRRASNVSDNDNNKSKLINSFERRYHYHYHHHYHYHYHHHHHHCN